MGYTIMIGERVKIDDPECPRFTVREIEVAEAPDFEDEPISAHRNIRMPSYSQWADFVDAVQCPMLGDEWLVQDHPGCQDIKPEHLAAVRDALEKWNKKHRSPPGFGHGQDGIKARLVWLEFWMDWALQHCKHPVVVNS